MQGITLLGFTAYCLICGVTYSVTSLALQQVPPLLLGGTRFLLASLPLWVIVLARRQRISRQTAVTFSWLALIIVSVPSLFTLYGMQFIPSGLVSLLWASSPVFVALFAHLLKEELFSRSRGLGVLLGCLGLTLIYADSLQSANTLQAIGVSFILTASLCYSFGILNIRRLHLSDNPVIISACMSLFGGFYLLLAAAVFERNRVLFININVIAEILYLIIFASCFAFTLTYWLLPRIGATTLTYSNLIAPVVAIWLSIAFLHENLPVTPALVGGGLLIVTGFILVAGRIPSFNLKNHLPLEKEQFDKMGQRMHFFNLKKH